MRGRALWSNPLWSGDPLRSCALWSSPLRSGGPLWSCTLRSRSLRGRGVGRCRQRSRENNGDSPAFECVHDLFRSAWTNDNVAHFQELQAYGHFRVLCCQRFTSLDVPVSNSIQTPLGHQTYVDCQDRLIKGENDVTV